MLKDFQNKPLEGRVGLDVKATAYVGEHLACQMPVKDAETLKMQMTK